MKPAMCRVCGKAEFGHTCAGIRVPILMSDDPPSKETRREAMNRALVAGGESKPKLGRAMVKPKTTPIQVIAGNMNPPAACQACGKAFVPKRSTARYCSPQCRDAKWRTTLTDAKRDIIRR